MKKYIVVIEFETGDIIKRLDVTGKTEKQIEKIDDGMNRNMDYENYYTIVREE